MPSRPPHASAGSVVAATIGLLVTTAGLSWWVAAVDGWARAVAILVSAVLLPAAGRLIARVGRQRVSEPVLAALTLAIGGLVASFTVAVLAVAGALNSMLYATSPADLAWGAVPAAGLVAVLVALGLPAALRVPWSRLLQRRRDERAPLAAGRHRPSEHQRE